MTDDNSRTQLHHLRKQYVEGDLSETEFEDGVEALLGGDDSPTLSFTLAERVEEVSVQTRDSGRITTVAKLEDAPAGQYELRRVDDE